MCFSQVGVFQFIPQVTNLVNEKIFSFRQWHDSAMLEDDDHSEEVTKLIKSSFNTVLIASQYIIKQYSMLKSQIMESGMYLQLQCMYF